MNEKSRNGAGRRTGIPKAAPAARRKPRRGLDGEDADDRRESEDGFADPVHTYLRDIGKVSLLDAALEVDLAQRMEEGVLAAKRLEDEQDLPAEEKAQLVRAVDRGQEAKDALIEANLRLVVSIAKRYRNKRLAFLDLIQEGNIGLMRAVEKFDHHKGFKFSTYATWWIRQSILRALADQSRTIRIPVHVVEDMNKVLRAQRIYVQEMGRQPTPEDLGSRLGMPPERVREMLRMNLDTLSLEQPVGAQEMPLSDVLEDRRLDEPNEIASRAMLHDAVRDALAALNERDRQVMQMRFGLLEDGKRYTLEEVARACGVTRERIRQIEIKTLAKLRKPDVTHTLREFLDEP